jgi:glycosyltransferase involved in cell wall biosynthesis
MIATEGPKTLIVPTHPGVQYHFCRVGLPTYFLGHWDQFQYWRPRLDNVHDLFPVYEESQLDYGPEDFARMLDAGKPFHGGLRFPEDFDLAWLMFNWQFTLFRERRNILKLYRVAKVRELTHDEWAELLSRDDFTVVSFYPNTVAWVKDTFGVELPYIPLGLDPDAYGPYTGEDATVLSVIHSWRDRGWHYSTYVNAMQGLPTTHVDHLDVGPDKPLFRYEDIQRAMRRSRVYLHDGEQEYTITLIEAMMTGMPIVAFRIPGIERYVEHGTNGFVVDDAKGLRDACRLLLDDADLAAKMGTRSRATAVRDFAEERWRREWIAAIDRFVRPRRG